MPDIYDPDHLLIDEKSEQKYQYSIEIVDRVANLRILATGEQIRFVTLDSKESAVVRHRHAKLTEDIHDIIRDFFKNYS